ncbi:MULTISPECIES: DUF5689 domain-containing protein [Chryseobacterium]|uniref:DUF5689 domain-containing protein n=1 Tax=Chryseobacterium taihuense TaxID=1141221 RepID=A0A4U8WM66_9FLAO|nr:MULTISPECIES: DUF5689 domain-containing protein [Chryseobacterium]QQV02782.1 choice-of-anchor J domain-containing protein [Chryseobacterium sp. FDAARGOS 1104]VFB03948.1 Uncharacterised protein [Chryseobacterium taihuense]
MKKYHSILKYFFVMTAAMIISGCVHDDKYDEPNLEGVQCIQDFTANTTLKQLREKYTLNNPTGAAYVFPADTTPNDSSDDLYIEGYVSSTDETGNIYKTIYIQDALENPTHGFTISVDAVSNYTKFPQGNKIYVKLNGLAVGVYGGVVQLGMKTGAETQNGAVSRIPEKMVPFSIFRSCNISGKIVPKIMTSAQMVSANDNLIGCLIQMNNAEFDNRILCTNYAPNGVTVDRAIRDNTSSTARVVRNSGYASFANQILPSGNGKFVGIYSKFNSTYQMYINKVSDLEMNNFPRLDGIASNPCEYSDNGLTQKTVAEIKQLATSPLTLITGDFVLKAKVIANDKSGNLFKYIYVEDATGGIRVNIDKNDMFNDPRFVVGKEVYIKLKNLYVGAVSGEIQLGSPFNGAVGRIAEADVYKYFFDSKKPTTAVTPTERTITQISAGDVGRWIKIKNLQFIAGDLEKVYAASAVTNRTLEDCSGNKILLRTSNFANFAGQVIEAGKGDVYGVLSVFNGTYQIWITDVLGADLDDPRCDGSVYVPLPVLYSENFAAGGFNADWTTVNVSGAQVWTTSNQGNGTNYYAVMNGFAGGNNVNEDWLISKSVSLVGKTKAAVSFTSDVRYNGNALQVYATENYTGNPATTNWVLLPATLDTNSGAFGDWVSSGNVDLSAFLGKNVRIAFKYTSTTSAAATWEIDDFRIKGL